MSAVALWKEAVAKANLRGDPLEPVLIRLGEVEEALERAIERLEQIGGTPVPAHVVKRAIRAALVGVGWRKLMLAGLVVFALGQASGFAEGWLAGHVPWTCVGR